MRWLAANIEAVTKERSYDYDTEYDRDEEDEDDKDGKYGKRSRRVSADMTVAELKEKRHTLQRENVYTLTT